MTLTLKLVENGKILVQIPLSPSDWSKEKLTHDLDSVEAHFTRYSKLFTALSNETRLMMMKQLIEKQYHPIKFTDFMRNLNLNPKLVWENTKKLREGGLVVKVGRGRYRCSELGATSFIMMSLAFRRLLHALEKMEE